MDIGTTAYTEYNESPDIVSYMIEKDLLDCHRGLIHSHNNMATFFSGTDTATLREEAVQHDHFVSLIVNNYRAYTAAVTTVVKSKYFTKEEFTYSTFDGKEVTDTDEFESEETTILWSKMAVVIEGRDYTDDEVLSRLDEIAKEKERLKTVRVTSPSPIVVQNTVQRQAIPPQTLNELLKDWDNKINAQDTQQQLPFNQGSEDLTEEDVRAMNMENPMDIPYDTIKLEPEIAELLAKKMVTGSILVPKNNRIDLKAFVPGMINMYAPVFPTKESYKFFIGGFVEGILFNIYDETLMGWEDDEIAAIAAYSIMEILEELPKNPFLEVIIDELEHYVI